MAGEWRACALGDVIELKRGYDLPQQDRHVGDVAVIASSGPGGFHDVAKVKGPGVVTGRYGTLGEVYFVRNDFWPLNTTLYVRDFKGNEPRFISYFLRSLDFLAYSDKAAVPGLNRNHLHQAQVSVPSDPAEQRAIAHILGTLDDKIELNRRMSETLEAMARALFQSWFVDFDPVRAKAARRDPGLPKHLADLFPARLVGSELGEMPADWSTGSLSTISELWRTTIDPQEHPEIVFDHHSIPAFDNGRWPARDAGASIKSQKTLVPRGSVLLSKLNPEIERVWLVDVQAPDRAICSTEFLVLQPCAPFGRGFVYCLTRSASFRRALDGMVTGTSKSHQRVQPASTMAVEVMLPPDRLTLAFERACAPMLSKALACERESRTLAALRDTLLPKLISGELRVKDAERFLEKAAS